MIRNNIEAIVKQLNSSPGFLYGTANELNLLSDKASWINGVVMLYTLKPGKDKATISHAINASYSVYMEFLYMTEFDEYSADNEVWIIKANALKEEFLVKLQAYRISNDQSKFFEVNVGDGDTSIPVYNKFDVNSTGVNLTINLATFNNTPYDPASRPPGWVASPFG